MRFIPPQGLIPSGIRLIQTQTVTATCTTVTFSGLNGNSDKAYYITGHMKGAITGLCIAVAQPNGASTNCHGGVYIDTGGTAARTLGSHMLLGLVGGASGAGLCSAFEATLQADATNALVRLLSGGGSAVVTGGSATYMSVSSGQWNDTTTNLTSLAITTVLYASPATLTAGIAPNSVISVYAISR